MLHRFDIDLPALIEALSAHLYSDKRVVLRELIQNARDSLLQLGPGAIPIPGQPSITVSSNPAGRLLVVSDNGVGMTADQAMTNLSVLARSGTKLLRQQLHDTDPEMAKLLAGQFGLGFFSSLMVAERVEVRSKSIQGWSPPVLWACERGSSGYTLEETDWGGTGTEVTLLLSPDSHDLTSRRHLEDLIRKYCDLVEFPILLNGERRPVNRLRAPWNEATFGEADAIQFLRDTQRIREDEDPLFVGLLPGEAGFGGVLFLPENADRDGEIALHVRHIFVNKAAHYASPSLSFLHGVIDCPNLPLTLSRESVVEGPILDELRRRVRDAALTEFRNARKQRPRTFRRVLQAYNRPLKMAALRDDAVMNLIADELEMRLATGQAMSLADLAAKSGGQIAFIDNAETQSAHGSLFAFHGKPVVDASDHLDLMLLRKYGEAKRTEVERADVSVGKLARAAEGPQWRLLEQLVAAVAPDLEPSAVELEVDIPALFLRGQRDVLRDIAAEAKESGADAGPLGLLVELLDKLPAKSRRKPLFLNVRHPLIQALAEEARLGLDREVLRSAVSALVASTRAYSEQLDPAGRKDACEATSAGLLVLLRGARSPDHSSAHARIGELEAVNAAMRRELEQLRQRINS